ncbi:hypothetical protein [Streptomyces rhizosphaericus]|uniref:Uncharacterized protein n=1 Tax=Streptomyces rhizosphaericus TaxID=114699 RepID=A0A6G4AWL2_9ACTN|nr:hypothetical protein [Streptomyces rhizosphaericus]NEW77765.1 hypothetical protein [Streptomyces rhizosphaericus]
MAHTGRRSHRNRPGGHRKPKTQKPKAQKPRTQRPKTQKPTTRQRTRRQTTRRALRREVPSTVALLADERDFAAMRHYESFAFDDHGAYLREMEGLLKALAAKGVHTTVALFDPVAYEEFCADTRLDPDTAASRTRYTAELAVAGGTVTYEGQPIARLVPRLIGVAEEQATWEYATALLSRVGHHGECRDDTTARAAFDRAGAALRAVVEAVGPGVHHLVCSVPADGTSLVAVLHADAREVGPPKLAEPSGLVFRTVLACGFALRGAGGLVLRTIVADSPETVRGWALQDGWLRPLSEAEVFTAYCTDAETGEPIPPEHGVEYRAGIPLSRPE